MISSTRVILLLLLFFASTLLAFTRKFLLTAWSGRRRSQGKLVDVLGQLRKPTLQSAASG